MKSDKNNIRKICCLLSCLLLFSCTEKDMSYFPLSEGITWRYNVEMDTIDGPAIQKYFLRSMGVDETDENKFHVFQLMSGTQLLYTKTDEGVRRAGFRIEKNRIEQVVDDDFLVLPGTIEEGVVWENIETTELLAMRVPAERRNLELLAKIPVKNEIVSVTDRVVLKDKVFDNCVHIISEGSEFNSNNKYIGRTLVQIKMERWYAPGIGLIKSERLETTTSAKLERAARKLELSSISYP